MNLPGEVYNDLKTVRKISRTLPYLNLVFLVLIIPAGSFIDETTYKIIFISIAACCLITLSLLLHRYIRTLTLNNNIGDTYTELNERIIFHHYGMFEENAVLFLLTENHLVGITLDSSDNISELVIPYNEIRGAFADLFSTKVITTNDITYSFAVPNRKEFIKLLKQKIDAE